MAALSAMELVLSHAPLPDADAMARARLWHTLVQTLPAEAFKRAMEFHGRTSTFFPKPAEIITAAQPHIEALGRAVANTIHPRRLNPSEDMKGFVFKSAVGLRKNPTWSSFLDLLHPTHEHCFFVNAEMTQYAHTIKGLSRFEAEYIREKWGDALTAWFKRGVVLGFGPGNDAVFTAERVEPSTPEARERMSKLVADFAARHRAPEAARTPKPPSQGPVSDALKALVAKQRAERGEAVEPAETY